MIIITEFQIDKAGLLKLTYITEFAGKCMVQIKWVTTKIYWLIDLTYEELVAHFVDVANELLCSDWL